jgi:phage baseplate assembly protein V
MMNQHIERLWLRIQNVIAAARTTTTDDSGAVQAMQLRFHPLQTMDGVPRLAEYGFQSNPPHGTDAVVLFMSGDRSKGTIVATNNQTYRMKGLGTGEVAISDDKGQSVYLSASGIRIDGGGLPITINNAPSIAMEAAVITLTGAIVLDGPVTSGTSAGAGPAHLTGPVTVDGDVTANGKSLHNHTHTSGGAGSPTSPPL